MTEVEATIPENSENVSENEPTNVEQLKKTEENSETTPNNSSENATTEAPAPKRGRPAGSKDRAPRRTVKVQPIPAPVEEAPPTPPPAAKPKAAPTIQRVAREPSLEPTPPSPRTLYRETSAQLVSLRELTHDQRRVKAADRYTSRLHSWGV